MAPAFSRRVPAVALIALALLASSGCSSLKFWDKNDGDKVIEGSPEQLYRDAIRDLKNENYAGAIQRYEMIEARYPFSEQAKQGQLDLLYAYYKARSTEQAIDQADQFIRENPTHPRVDYAYYIRGLVYFDNGANWLERKFHADIAKRPPTEARKSFQSFQQLVRTYPKSPYAADARQRMIYMRNRLADYEIEVARYYMKRGAYVGAVNRAKGVVETYDGAPAVDNALKIMENCYTKLGLPDLAKTAADVRVANDVQNRPDVVNPGQAALLAMAAEEKAEAKEKPAWQFGGAPDQAGDWEATVGLTANTTTDVSFEGGSTASVKGGLGFAAGLNYNFTDRIRLGTTFTYDSKDYDAVIAGDTDGESYKTKGSIDTMALMVDAAYTFMTGPISPYVVAGLGWAWVDTNIATEPPTVGCWWSPWWGYVCTTWQDSRTLDGLAYEVGVGMRYDFSNGFAADAAYRMRWMDYEHATGTPSTDALLLNLVWKF